METSYVRNQLTIKACGFKNLRSIYLVQKYTNYCTFNLTKVFKALSLKFPNHDVPFMTPVCSPPKLILTHLLVVALTLKTSVTYTVVTHPKTPAVIKTTHR